MRLLVDANWYNLRWLSFLPMAVAEPLTASFDEFDSWGVQIREWVVKGVEAVLGAGREWLIRDIRRPEWIIQDARRGSTRSTWPARRGPARRGLLGPPARPPARLGSIRLGSVGQAKPGPVLPRLGGDSSARLARAARPARSGSALSPRRCRGSAGGSIEPTCEGVRSATQGTDAMTTRPFRPGAAARS